MTTSDFAQRHGYEEEHRDFESPDHLPDDVRKSVGYMILDQFASLSRWQERFVDVVRRSLPGSRDLLEWYESIPLSRHFPDGVPYDLDHEDVQLLLISPLRKCDWPYFYAVVENVCAEWDRTGSTRSAHFLPEFNWLLSCHGIPWMLQGGWVIPVADSEFAEDLKHAREVAHPPTADHVNDPHMLIRDALAALYRKQGGPDLSASCVHAWGAWKAATSAASGFGARDRRTFEFVGDEYHALGLTMKAWQKLAEEGRHPETGAPLTESETRFIVMLCVNAVRFLCPMCRSGDAA